VAMDDERIVKLLEEIRDLQRQHVENYKHALDNQKESIEFNRRWQREASRRQFWGFLLLLAAIAALWFAAIVNR
jgi:hypothetical protein